ncbi:MAG: sigma-54-dependent Fis family transcriptional regulator [Silvanigrellales bacterium]|nr:sigma-54-dependent Fis family transcriptional regulator [Silvanigrellales bacterium]
MSVLSALIGTSTVIRHVQHLVLKVAEADAPVLITGEAGTGKELVARAIHEKSARAAGPFVAVKCGAEAEEILESELFGHEKGAFAATSQTSALASLPAREGQLVKATGGTVFLEEVSKLSPKLQIALMRALQEGIVQPVGSETTHALNVRIICSTSVNIDLAVRERSFREDLYYRLAGCAVYIPPLRERREDIPPLVEHFIHKYNQAKGKSIFGVSPDAMSALLQHAWAHNIRELENLVERIVVLKNSGSIEVCDLPPRLRNLVTDNIDAFYERQQNIPHRGPGGAPSGGSPAALSANAPSRGNTNPNAAYARNPLPSPASQNHLNYGANRGSSNTNSNFAGGFPSQGSSPYGNVPPPSPSYDDASEIDQFIKKDIDLGSGIDFYRVVEEFENRLIAEALRRTNHNKNRAAQLLSMNRTTLVEKLKKRAASSSVKVETDRIKRNPAFTIFDGLGNEHRDFDALDFVTKSNDNLGDID